MLPNSFHLLALGTQLPSVIAGAIDASVSSLESRAQQAGQICSGCKPGSSLTCCQATFAGDLFSVQFLANVTGYQLEPRDVNCIGIRADQYSDSSSCVGVKTCCDVVLPQGVGSGLGGVLDGILKTQVLGLYCQGINQTCSTRYGACGAYH